MQIGSATMETSMRLLKKLNIDLSDDPALPLLSPIWKDEVWIFHLAWGILQVLSLFTQVSCDSLC